MKLLDFEVNLQRPQKKDLPAITNGLTIENVKPSTVPISKIPRIAPKVLNYHQNTYSGRGSFTSAVYDLSEIGKIEDVDGYLRQSFKKKQGLMFKEGLDYAGANKQTIQYIKTRMAQIAQATGIPALDLMKRIGHSLIRVSNAFLIKARDTKASGGKVRTTPNNKSLKPIAGYFPAAPETMRVSIDNGTGKIVGWRQLLPNGRYRDYPVEDVIHFTIDRREGFIWGVPTVIPVIDDIRALRQIEENVELLLYQHLFPIFQYIVGTENAPAGYTEEGVREIDAVEEQIKIMPSEGAIVTPERHEIKAIGAEGRAVRAEGYLEHFKKRVIAGLGISSVDLGDGETANRACYSEDTETLTENGWKYYWEINPEIDKIATYNPETNLIEFCYPQNGIFLYDYDGEMIHFTNQHIDVLVTPDHDMWTNINCSVSKKWKKVQAKDITCRDFKFLTSAEGTTIAKNVDFFDLPYIPYKCYSIVPNGQPFSIPMDDWLEFLGYFISEGTYGRTQNKYAISLSQSETVYPEQTQKIRECLERLPFKFNEYKDIDGVTRFWINCKSLYLYLFNEVGNYSYQKRIPREYLDLSDRQICILFDALILGDGGADKRENRTSFDYSSSSNELINQVQEICVRLGYRSIVNTGTRCNRLSISKHTTSMLTRTKNAIVTEQYSGKVYCFHVPNHLFITRRFGKVGIHGNTARTMSRALVDTVKDIQDSFKSQWDYFVIQELLLESTFGVDVLDEANMVHLVFAEIDIDSKIERETHLLEMFKGYAITFDELRSLSGREPILIPEDPQDQDMKKYPEWAMTYWKLIEEPLSLIKAVDEPYSGASLAAAEARSLGITGEQLKKAGDERASAEQKKVREERKIATKKPVADNFITPSFRDLEDDMANLVNNHLRSTSTVKTHDLLSHMRTWAEDIKNKFMTPINNGLRRGFADETGQSISSPRLMNIARDQMDSRISYYLDRLIHQTISQYQQRVADLPPDVRLQEVRDKYVSELHIVFDALVFRTRFLWDTEIKKAYSLGRLVGLRHLGYDFANVSTVDACEQCIALSGPYKSEAVDVNDLVPHHPGCRCYMKRLIDVSQQQVRESVVGAAGSPIFDDVPLRDPNKPAVEPADPAIAEETTICPVCGTTAMWKEREARFYCIKCRKSFTKEEE